MATPKPLSTDPSTSSESTRGSAAGAAAEADDFSDILGADTTPYENGNGTSDTDLDSLLSGIKLPSERADRGASGNQSQARTQSQSQPRTSGQPAGTVEPDRSRSRGGNVSPPDFEVDPSLDEIVPPTRQPVDPAHEAHLDELAALAFAGKVPTLRDFAQERPSTGATDAPEGAEGTEGASSGETPADVDPESIVDLEAALATIALTAHPERADLEQDDDAEDVRLRLYEKLNGRGEPIGIETSLSNVARILRFDGRWGPNLRLNLMSANQEWCGAVVEKPELVQFAEAIRASYGISATTTVVEEAAVAVAFENQYHPVRNYLRAAKSCWDGTPRIDHLARAILGTRVPLHQTMVRKMMIACVARAFTPGCKFDHALVLQGQQGLRKSSFFAALAGRWFSATAMDVRSKDALQQLHSAWIYEWGEIEKVMRTSQPTDMRIFLSNTSDSFRPPYARSVKAYPRTTVIVGSTNEREFLSDPCGSRRFWVIPVRQRLDIETVLRWRDQLWGEAVALWESGEQLHLTDTEEKLRAEMNDAFEVTDSVEFTVSKFLYGIDEPLTAEMVIRDAFDRGTPTNDTSLLARVTLAMSKSGWRSVGRISLMGSRFRVWVPPSWIESGRSIEPGYVQEVLLDRLSVAKRSRSETLPPVILTPEKPK